ncbi:MAG TPA: type II toxin-antitoxin system ParD family antitoxin [Sphingomicrobium sp.]|nr:type II toxin-antitoxin system ParD family antitoxin [Sphingomicrobium sp.]
MNAMASNTSIILSNHFREFAERKVREGRYASTSDVVRAGLRLLETEEEKIEALRREIQKGIDSGPPEPFELEEFLAEMHREHR